ncbi:MAG: hypothetical protein GXY80_02975 [Syntrophorhabdus aromaticivorans]|uniref:C2H2-type domain-containing protein n=1 Tax=Syntrophorhabdus aromaticivorans TaxID=328301 RepID=A0A971M351_9BACT|nr:hypothetical protein [Syntrophorhabdus aromaticivorans]
MAKAKTLKCSKCDRTFSMPGHLGRHMVAMHGATPKTKPAKKGKIGRRGRPRGKRPGRPKGISKKMGLANMTIDQLAQLIDAAKDEAQRRIGQLQRAFE